MGLVAGAIGRGWANFLARPSGPLNIRFLIQPTVAAVMAVRAGIEDARLGRPAFQFAVQQFIYPLELLFTSALLAVVPYCVLRGPINRVARKAMRRNRLPDSTRGDREAGPR